MTFEITDYASAMSALQETISSSDRKAALREIKNAVNALPDSDTIWQQLANVLNGFTERALFTEEVLRLHQEYDAANRDYEAAWREYRKVDFEFRNEQNRYDELGRKVGHAQDAKEKAHIKYLQAVSNLEELEEKQCN